MLEKEVKDLLANGNGEQFLIDAENMKNKSLEEKDISLSINFSLVTSFAFGIVSLVLGMFFGKVENIISFYIVYFLSIGINIFVIYLLVNRARDILKYRNEVILFYEKLCRAIKANLEIVNVESVEDII